MKRTLVIATLVVTAWMFNSAAQDTGTQAGGSGQAGQGGQHKRPSPEQMAKELMSKFDANKDGELSQDELTQAVEALEKNHPQRPGGGGQGGQWHHHGQAGGNGQQGAEPGGEGAQQGTDQGAQSSQQHTPPSPDKIAAKMIEKFSSDKKGLTEAELAKAIAERLANRGQHGGGQHGNGGGQQGSSGQQGPGGQQDGGTGN